MNTLLPVLEVLNAADFAQGIVETNGYFQESNPSGDAKNMTPDETVNALRERGHNVEMLDGERGVILELDGHRMTIGQAQDLLNEEIEVEEP